jgi:hypothetical protein
MAVMTVAKAPPKMWPDVWPHAVYAQYEVQAYWIVCPDLDRARYH